MVIITFAILVILFGGVWYATGAPLVSATATQARMPLVTAGQGGQVSTTITPADLTAKEQANTTPIPTATQEPIYKDTQHAQAMRNLSNQATLEANLARTESAFNLAIAHQDATATQQAEDQLDQWANEQATQDAETAALIAQDKQAEAKAKADIALANFNHTKQMNKIAEDDLALRLANERERDNTIGWIVIGIATFAALALVIVFFRQLNKNMSKPARPGRTEQPPAIISAQATDYRSMLSEADYLRIVRTLKVATETNDGQFANSTKMPHFSELPGISSEVRSRAAHVLAELKLLSIHDNKASIKGTFYANHMTNQEMYSLFTEGKKNTPLPHAQDKSQMWTGSADHPPPIMN